MKNNEWVKTILTIYRFLDRVCEGIDALVEQNALYSYHYRTDNQVMNVSKRIIDLIERKSRLVNIKVLVDNCLIKCDKQLARLLIERYIDDDDAENIAVRQKISIRTYFRKLIQAENSFYSYMKQEGFGEEKLNQYLAGEKWIIETCEKFKTDGRYDS